MMKRYSLRGLVWLALLAVLAAGWPAAADGPPRGDAYRGPILHPTSYSGAAGDAGRAPRPEFHARIAQRPAAVARLNHSNRVRFGEYAWTPPAQVVTATEDCLPLSDVVLDGPDRGLLGALLVFTATAAPLDATAPLTYTWTPPPLAGQGSAVVTYTWNSIGPLWDEDTPQGITATVANCGGVVTATRWVTLFAPMQADFWGAPVKGPPPLNVQFTSTLTGTVSAFAWDFGDGEGSVAANPGHQYTAAGSYTVTMVVDGAAGNVVTVVKPAYVDTRVRLLHLPIIVKAWN